MRLIPAKCVNDPNAITRPYVPSSHWWECRKEENKGERKHLSCAAESYSCGYKWDKWEIMARPQPPALRTCSGGTRSPDDPFQKPQGPSSPLCTLCLHDVASFISKGSCTLTLPGVSTLDPNDTELDMLIDSMTGSRSHQLN